MATKRRMILSENRDTAPRIKEIEKKVLTNFNGVATVCVLGSSRHTHTERADADDRERTPLPVGAGQVHRQGGGKRRNPAQHGSIHAGEAGATLTTPENRATKPLWINCETARITLNFWISREKRDYPECWAENMAVAIGALESIGQWWDENIDTDVFTHSKDPPLHVEQTFNAAWGKIRQSAALYSTSTEQYHNETAIYTAAMRAVVSDAAEDAEKAGDGRKASSLWRLRRMLL